jgi:nucleotide-binding universal stress UspA family protein
MAQVLGVNGKKGESMLPIKKIISPTDFSEPSYAGVKAANELAAQFSAEMILVHVVPPAHPFPPTRLQGDFEVLEYSERLIAASRESLDQVAKKMIAAKTPSLTLILEGDPADEIVNLASSETADLIVIASHGWTGWHRFIFGSVAEKVVRFAPCPVLTIPATQGKERRGGI